MCNLFRPFKASYSEVVSGVNKKMLVKVNCGSGIAHIFHKKCILGWINSRRNCPLCRRGLRYRGDDAVVNAEMAEHLLHPIYSNNLEEVERLLRDGATANIRSDWDSDPLLFTAVRRNLVQMTQLLLDNHVNINVRNYDGDTVLSLACVFENINLDLINLLLARGANPNVINLNHDTLLIRIVRMNAVHVVRLLLDSGASINARGEDNETCLLIACGTENPNLDLISLLLDRGADINYENDHGFTPLRNACMYNNGDLIRLLLRHNAVIDFSDALGWAVLNNNIEFMRFWFGLEANINTIDDGDGETLLMVACNHRNVDDIHIDTIRFLFANGFTLINNQIEDESYANNESNGFTALMFLCKHVNINIEIVRMLLELGADVDTLRNDADQTALDVARVVGNIGIVRLLEEYRDRQLGIS